MKIISGKRWEEINQQLVDLQMDLNEAKKDNALYLEQVNYLQHKLGVEKEYSQSITKIIDEDAVKITTQKEIIRKLKTLLTKNGIDYKKMLEKKEK